jgi:nucleotide-binding universal stress UspA family protein
LYGNLLIALDLEAESDAPLKAGLRLAGEYGAALRVVSAIRPALLSSEGFFRADVVDRDELLAQAKQALNSRIAAITTDQIPSDVLVGNPSETIAAAAAHRQSDLIVIGARPRSGPETILGTTATNVLRRADRVDIYACHRTDPEAPANRILVAIDGSDLTPLVLSEATHLIRTSNAVRQVEVRIVCVVEDLKWRSETVRARSEEYVAASELADRQFQVAEGEVVGCLEQAVREFDADLLVIGSGNNFGVTWFIGSTTNNILHESACDVLVIRPG